MRHDQIGKTREKLSRMFAEKGFAVDPLHIYRIYSTYKLDLARWEAHGFTKGHPTLIDGLKVNFSSWDRMKECAKGFEFDDRSGFSFEVWATPNLGHN